MAAGRNREASSSMSPCTYHAFLSFRGKDIRKSFLDHLYTALVQAGIHTFRDDDEIERGKNIEEELEKAIQESKILIIVFSNDYASSRWCLQELVNIMQRRKTVGHHVLPVFYDVDPSQVRHQTGSYAEAFARHEERFKEKMDTIQEWRAALREVADLGGMVLSDRHESEFINDVVKEIRKKLDQNHTKLFVGPYLVGMESRMKDINLWLQDGSSDNVGIATVYGIGGIGKTTIAKTVFNLNYVKFEASCFLANIRETAEQPNGLVRLQKQLLSQILKGKTSKIHSIDEGIQKIKQAICCRKVLLVLDDVDDELDQLNAIIGMREWLYPGSKILVTTRHERLLRIHDVYKMFKVEELDEDASLQLFSWHAFGRDHPAEANMELSRNAVNLCGGLPLALEVLGSSLSRKNMNIWASALHKLEEIPDSKIQKILRISYDSLQDDHDKNLFLDIACFFVEKNVDYTAAILDGCGFYTKVGIQNLIDRCLLTINGGNKLMMHQLLRDMGREIVRQESPEEPGKRTRICHHKDAFSVLRDKTGTDTIKGLTLDLNRIEDKNGKRNRDSSEIWTEDHYGKFPKSQQRGFFAWIAGSDGAGIETNAFAKMHNLKLLQLAHVKLDGGYKDFPGGLIWLCWRGCPLQCIPNELCLSKLVVLDMRNNNLKYVWNGTRFLPNLELLDLSHSHSLVRTPDFTGLPSLKRIVLKDCINLVEVSDSIGGLHKLVSLNLKECKNLLKLPRRFGKLKQSLEVLILSGCSNLVGLPEDMGELESLRILEADKIAANQLEFAIDKRNSDASKSWHSIFWFLSPLNNTPQSQPGSFSLAFLPKSLVILSLISCNLSDDAIPNDLGILSSLKSLDLSGNPIHTLPRSIKNLTLLCRLALIGCSQLKSLPELPGSLLGTILLGCDSLELITNLPNSSCRLSFLIRRCECLCMVLGMYMLEPKRDTDIESSELLQMANVLSLTHAKEIQFMHEYGMTNIILAGSHIPSWFRHQCMGCSVSFNIHQPTGYKIRGLSLCCVYGFPAGGAVSDRQPKISNVGSVTSDRRPTKIHHINVEGRVFGSQHKISNVTKNIEWIYTPSFHKSPDVDKDVLWLTHWKFGDLDFENGDRVDVSVGVIDSYEVKHCGVHLVYEREDIIESSSPLFQSFDFSHTLSGI